MPDFGIMRGFGSKLFSDKLVAGQLPTQLGKIGSDDFGTDPDAQAFITSAGITNSTQQLAIDTLVKSLKTYNIWTKMKGIYPIVGGSVDNHKYNLKDPRDLDGAFRLAFTSGWTHSSTGATPNGTSAYANTFINSNTLPFTSNHMSSYGATSNLTRIHYNMGAKDYFYIEIGSYGGGNNLGPGTFKSGLTNNSGFFLASRSALSTTKLSQNNSILDTSTSTAQNTRDSLVIFGARSDGNPTTLAPINYADGEVRFVTIGDGLTDTEASDFYTAVQAFQTTLGRQV